jgi:hypothetical protein
MARSQSANDDVKRIRQMLLELLEPLCAFPQNENNGQ